MNGTNKNVGIAITLVAGGLFLYSRRGDITNAASENLSFNIVEGVSFRVLIAERSKVEVRFNVSVKNDNYAGGTIQKMIGNLKWQGASVGTFELAQPVTIAARETTTFEVVYFLDITNRSLPAEIRNIWRTGNFNALGLVFLDSMITTSFGTVEYKEIIKVL